MLLMSSSGAAATAGDERSFAFWTPATHSWASWSVLVETVWCRLCRPSRTQTWMLKPPAVASGPRILTTLLTGTFVW